MCALEDVVFAAVDRAALGLGEGPLQEKDDAREACRDGLDNGVCEDLRPAMLVAVGRPPAHGECGIQE